MTRSRPPSRHALSAIWIAGGSVLGAIMQLSAIANVYLLPFWLGMPPPIAALYGATDPAVQIYTGLAVMLFVFWAVTSMLAVSRLRSRRWIRRLTGVSFCLATLALGLLVANLAMTGLDGTVWRPAPLLRQLVWFAGTSLGFAVLYRASRETHRS